MSIDAIRWAFDQPVGKSSAKFLLVAMANHVRDASMTCWPSSKHLSDVTCQDIKTVDSGLHRLRDGGYITDTGARKGATGQVIVYQLNTPVFVAAQSQETPPKTVVLTQPNTPGNGCLPKLNTPVFPVKHPRFSRETPPKTGDGTVYEPYMNQEEKKTAHALDIPADLLSDFMAVRKAKRAGPLTNTAVRGLEREAGKAGLTLVEAITACCEFGWQGFNAGWYAERTKKSAPAGQPTETVYQRSMRLRYEEATGRSNTGPAARNVIDITPAYVYLEIVK